jgi:hypothetical protein
VQEQKSEKMPRTLINDDGLEELVILASSVARLHQLDQLGRGGLLTNT